MLERVNDHADRGKGMIGNRHRKGASCSSLKAGWNQSFLCIFVLSSELNTDSCVIPLLGATGFINMLDRGYFLRQIRTLLKFAKQTTDPLFAAFLMEKVVHLKSQVEEIPPARDIGPAAPDVEPENRSE